MLEKTAIVILAEFEMTMQEFQNHMFKPHLKVFLRLSLHSSFIFLYFVLEFLTKNYPSWCAARGGEIRSGYVRIGGILQSGM